MEPGFEPLTPWHATVADRRGIDALTGADPVTTTLVRPPDTAPSGRNGHHRPFDRPLPELSSPGEDPYADEFAQTSAEFARHAAFDEPTPVNGSPTLANDDTGRIPVFTPYQPGPAAVVAPPEVIPIPVMPPLPAGANPALTMPTGGYPVPPPGLRPSLPAELSGPVPAAPPADAPLAAMAEAATRAVPADRPEPTEAGPAPVKPLPPVPSALDEVTEDDEDEDGDEDLAGADRLSLGARFGMAFPEPPLSGRGNGRAGVPSPEAGRADADRHGPGQEGDGSERVRTGEFPLLPDPAAAAAARLDAAREGYAAAQRGMARAAERGGHDALADPLSAAEQAFVEGRQKHEQATGAGRQQGIAAPRPDGADIRAGSEADIRAGREADGGRLPGRPGGRVTPDTADAAGAIGRLGMPLAPRAAGDQTHEPGRAAARGEGMSGLPGQPSFVSQPRPYLPPSPQPHLPQPAGGSAQPHVPQPAGGSAQPHVPQSATGSVQPHVPQPATGSVPPIAPRSAQATGEPAAENRAADARESGAEATGAEHLPQRVPAVPDVPPAIHPVVEAEPVVAATPQLDRIASHLRRSDDVGTDERPDGFDVDAVLRAVRGVAGVRDAALRTTATGAHHLRLDLAEGADPAAISRMVARMLQEQMGIDAAPAGPLVPKPAPPSDTPPPTATLPAPRSGAGAAPPPGLTGGLHPDPLADLSPREPRRRHPVSVPRRTPGELRDRVAALRAVNSEPELPATASPPPLPTERDQGPRAIIEHVQTSTFGLDATVEVRLNTGDRQAVGVASGPAVDAYVLRLCAAATAVAIDDLLREGTTTGESGRCFVEQATIVSMGSCEVAVVVVLLVCGGWVEQLAGSALVSGDPRRAVVRATLSAVNRRLAALLP
ncbi:hypothetical protein [Catellatospora methionotrophica]|uniref:hypothetical protein n=1 Tax=Catellatospora methionotrophica TaxID=121620 RepID=UPI00340E0C17